MSYLRPNHLKNDYNYLSIPKNKPKIFCMITTTDANHETKAIHVKNTWAKRCDGLLFLSSQNNSTLPSIKICGEDSHDKLWCKVSIVCANHFFELQNVLLN
jgi:glycoprotein-N-acetylgalactosamine 3-beta-galactosyltransferase